LFLLSLDPKFLENVAKTMPAGISKKMGII
jgi:hypothetical protein